MSTLAEAEAGFPEASLMALDAPTARDASGNSVPASLSVRNDIVTLTIQPPAGTAYPIIVAPAVAAPSARRRKPTTKHYYGFADHSASVYDSFDQNLVKKPLQIKTARLVIPYDLLTHVDPGPESAIKDAAELQNLEHWLNGVSANGLQPFITLGRDDRAEVCQQRPTGEHARGCHVPSPAQYEAGLHALLNSKIANGALARVKYWGAWNEPDLGDSPLLRMRPAPHVSGGSQTH